MKSVKNQYFLKDKKIQVYKKVSNGIGPEGYPLPSAYYPIAPKPIWAHARQLSQTDIFIAQAYNQTETRVFVINFYRGIEVYDMVLYRGEWYRITRVDTQEDYNGEVFLYVENAKGGWIPDPEEIQPYNPDAWK